MAVVLVGAPGMEVIEAVELADRGGSPRSSKGGA